MKYMLLIHHGETPVPGQDAWDALSREQQESVSAAYQALNATPGVTPGQYMQPPDAATTVRVADGRTLTTDGPFAETKDALGGYLFLEADDLDAAIAVAARIPAAYMGGGVEIRPLVEW
ncbi:MAG: YciI family protein [Thermoleophilia bacterium]